MKKIIIVFFILTSSVFSQQAAIHHIEGYTLPNYAWSMEFFLNAPTCAYANGDSALFVYKNVTDSVLYFLQVPYKLQDKALKINTLNIYLNGDASSIIDSIRIIANNLGVDTVLYSYTTATNCTGSNQTISLTPNVNIESTMPMLMWIWYNVNTSVKTFYFKIKCIRQS